MAVVLDSHPDQSRSNNLIISMPEPSDIQLNQAVLPEPEAEAKVRSHALCERIKTLCTGNGGCLPFAKYMQQALYSPELGYYSGDLQKFGPSGDFITAPEVSPLFSQCLARQVADVLASLAHPVILEFGAGSGVMAADILLELEKLEILPVKYMILELSAELKQRQINTIQSKVPHLLDKVTWLESLPDTKISAVVLANEVLDAMPVECFRISSGTVELLHVCHTEQKLSTTYTLADAETESTVRLIEERRGGTLPDAYCSEFNPALSGWLKSVNEVLSSGMVLVIDYGYNVHEYYHEERNTGTLMCHYRHRAHADPLWYPGLQDITAFVDFSDVAYSAVAAGLDVSGYTSQAAFLIACGLGELHQSLVTDDPKLQIILSQQIKTLTLPSEMGERFKVMALTKAYDEPLRGFMLQDYRNRL